MTRLAAVLLVTLAFPAGAAAATWTPPQHLARLSRAYPFNAPQFTDDGRGLAMVSEADQGGPIGRDDFVRSAAGEWTARFRNGARGLRAVRQAVAGDGSVVLVGVRPAPGASVPEPTHGLGARLGRLGIDGVSFGDPHTLTSDPALHGFDIAGNRAGHVAVAWDVKKAPSNRRGVFVVRRRPHHELGKVIRLSGQGAMAGTVSAAVAPDGYTVVAWRRLDTMFVRIAPPGRPFGRSLKIAATDRPHHIALAPGDGGRLLAAWTGDSSQRIVVARRGTSGDFRFTSFPGFSPPSAVVDSVGRGVVAFDSHEGTQVASFAGGPPSFEAIPGPGKPHGLVAGPHGKVALLLLSDPAPTPTAYVSLRRGPEAFHAPESVSPEDQYVADAGLGLNPVTLQPSVLFEIYPDEFAGMTEAYVTSRVP